MIISFYDKNFKALQNNSGLVVDKESFKLIKRPCEFNDFSCKCEAFTENIQPTFLVVKDDKGSNSLVYSSLAGIPLINKENKTEINATDLKSMLSSKIIIEKKDFENVNAYISYLFNAWKESVNQGSIPCELTFNDNVGQIAFTDLKPDFEKAVIVINVWDEIKQYLKFYKLFMDTSIDLVVGKVIFIIGRTMFRTINIKLWEYGIKNYGKWVADINESQGYYCPPDITSKAQLIAGYKWILTSKNQITQNADLRDIYPIKRNVVLVEKSGNEANAADLALYNANKQALSTLLDSLFNENIEIPVQTIRPTFETNFAVYVNKGEEKYKDLPCGELHYNANGLYKVQIGFRYTDVNFI